MLLWFRNHYSINGIVLWSIYLWCCSLCATKARITIHIIFARQKTLVLIVLLVWDYTAGFNGFSAAHRSWHPINAVLQLQSESLWWDILLYTLNDNTKQIFFSNFLAFYMEKMQTLKGKTISKVLVFPFPLQSCSGLL